MIAQYLLGELSAEESGRLEERLFANEGYEQLLVVEEELIEAYVRGELSARDRERFENHFLTSPARRERVEFTKTLFKALEEITIDQTMGAAGAAGAAEPASAVGAVGADLAVPELGDSTSRWSAIFASPRLSFPAWRVSLATAGLIVLIGGAWLLVENQRLRSQSEQLRADLAQARQQQDQLAEQRARNEQLAVELRNARDQLALSQTPSVQPAESPSSILAFLFTENNSSRGGGERRRLIIPRGAQQIQLQFQFPQTESYRGYLASLHTPEGDQITTSPAKLIAPARVALTLKTNLLRTNDYILTLKGLTAAKEVEEIADYQFTIEITNQTK
ncbi:MAG: zf-HC2 domain-containing protein [Acidobacteria bacterium]|nr:zf-HC2 domain-containing protein [Acidobacteriota bacterium]